MRPAAISRLLGGLVSLPPGPRVQFGRNFETNGRLVIRGPGRVIFGDDIKAWCHAEKNVFITYTPDRASSVGSGTRLNGAGIMAYTTIAHRPALHPRLDGHLRQRLPPARPGPPPRPGGARLHAARSPSGPMSGWPGKAPCSKARRIGENSVVAFRAVVSGDVPPNVVVAGNPARVVKRFDGAGAGVASAARASRCCGVPAMDVGDGARHGLAIARSARPGGGRG